MATDKETTPFTNKKPFLLAVVIGLYLLVLTPLLLINLQNRQDTRGRAQNTNVPTPNANTQAVCGNAPADIMVVLDRSSSMNGTKITQAKAAAKSFVDILAANPQNRVGLVTFANPNTTAVNVGLTNNFTSVKSAIDQTTLTGGTCIQCALNKANQEIQAHSRTGLKPVIVFLTDGRPTATETKPWPNASGAEAEQAALSAAKNVSATTKSAVFTIGLGSDVNTSLLQQIATLTGGKYYFAPQPDQLSQIYKAISEVVGKGSITGFVFNDANSNGVFDQTEQKLPGWTLQLFPQGSTTPQTFTTDSTGDVTISGLCDGKYQLKEVLQTGWRQTLPSDPNGYTITINNGAVFTDKNFGNSKASRCSDNIDNDNNGFTDINDSTCHTDGNPKNPNSYDPQKDGEHGGNTCADSKDNNGNGLIDGADPVCHTDKNPNNPGSYDPNLPEIATSTSLSCTPTSVTLTDFATQFSITLKDSNGAALPNKTITWSAQNSAIAIFPTSSQTDSIGKASSSALVSLNNSTAFTSTITAKYAGDSSNAASSCTIQATYKPILPTTLSLTVLLDGIGSRGDNSNPDVNSLSNKNPLHPTKTTDVLIYDTNNQVAASGTGTITYNKTAGNFTGTIDVGRLGSGKYTVKVRTERYLRRLVAGIQTITAGKENNLPTTALVAGDVNNDNRLDILDYNLLLDCYSDLQPAVNCNDANKKLITDINDDGKCNQVDYNLFIRELSTQPGE